MKQNNSISVPYKLILRKFWEGSEFHSGRVGVRKAKLILSWYFRFGKQNVGRIFKEMKKKGYVEFESQKFLEVKVPLSDLD